MAGYSPGVLSVRKSYEGEEMKRNLFGDSRLIFTPKLRILTQDLDSFQRKNTNGTLKRKSLGDIFNDVISYMVLLKGLIRERRLL